MSNLTPPAPNEVTKLISLTGRSLTPQADPLYPSYEIQVPKEYEGLAHRVSPFFHSLYVQGQKLILTIRANSQFIRWIVTPTDNDPLSLEVVKAMIQPHFPEAQISPFQIRVSKLPTNRQWAIYQLVQPEWFTPLKTIADHKQELPLQTLIRVMSSLKAGEEALFELYITGGRVLTDYELTQALFIPASQAGEIYEPRITFHWLNALVEAGRTLYNNYRLTQILVPRFEPSEIQRYVAKVTQPLLQVRMSLLFDTPYAERKRLFMALNSALQAWKTSESSLEPRLINSKRADGNPINSYQQWLIEQPIIQLALNARNEEKFPDLISCTSLWLTVDELATLWHLPNKEFK